MNKLLAPEPGWLVLTEGLIPPKKIHVRSSNIGALRPHDMGTVIPTSLGEVFVYDKIPEIKAAIQEDEGRLAGSKRHKTWADPELNEE